MDDLTAALEQRYNNRAAVPDFAQHFDRWTRSSKVARDELDCDLDIPYGDHPMEKVDIFRAEGRSRALLMFIHGGYWRALDKRDHSFIAPGLTEAGVTVAVPNYALCPAVTIPQICTQMVRALAWLWHHAGEYGADRSRITVWGHSAGGHLAAMMQSALWPQFDAALPRNLVKNSLSISGLFDLEPVRQTPFLMDSLRLTPQDALRASPARMPAPAHGDLYAVAGAQESAEFIRQNQLIAEVWGGKRVPVCEALAGLNHFSVLEALTLPGHRLQALAMERIAQI